MALTITTAGSGAAPVATAEQPVSGSSTSQTSDAFAGVLAGVGKADGRPSQQNPAEDRTGARSEQPGDAEGDAQAAADLAVLALLAPALPASTVALFNSGYSAAGTASGQGASSPVEAPAAGSLSAPGTSAAPAAAATAATARAQLAGAAQLAASTPPAGTIPAAGTAPLAGTAPPAGSAQTADPARQADSARTMEPAVLRPMQPVAAQAAVTARQDELPVAGQLPAPATGQPAQLPAAAGAAGQTVQPITGSQSNAAGQPSNATTPPASGDAGPSTAGSAPVPVSLPAGVPSTVGTAASALSQAFTVIQSTDSTPAAGQPAKAPADAAVSLAGTVSLSGTSAVAATPGAVRASTGSHHRPVRAAAGEPAEPVVAAAPAASSTLLDPAAPTPPAGSSAVQAAPVGVAAGQPVEGGRDPQPVHQHPAADQPVAGQVAGPVLALRARGDGSHQLIVALHPAELGPVNVHVRIAGDAMTISLASTSETAHETLREALPQLRAELQSAGLNPASLSLDLTSGDAGAFADPRFADPGQGEPRQPGDQRRSATAPVDQSHLPVRPRVSGARVGAFSSSGLDRWL